KAGVTFRSGGALRQFQARIGIESSVGEVVGAELVVGGGGNHGGVVCGEGAAGEEYFEAGGLGGVLKGGAELGVCGYATGDQDAFGVELFGCEHGAFDQVADNGVL